MAKSTKKDYGERKLVMRFTHAHVLINFSFDPREFSITTRSLAWQLPKPIDPNNINPDMEFLIAFMSRMVRQYKLEGERVSWILPSKNSKLKVLTIPLNLNVKGDKKEFDTLTKATPYEFWKEYDSDLAEMRGAEIRSQFLTANAEENSSQLLYSACDKQVVRNYQNLSLASNLYPIEYIPIDQSLLKIVESRLTRIHRERPFAIFHLSKGDHRIIYVRHEHVEVAKVNIDELDETLLEDFPLINDENKDFWSDVMERIGTNLQAATNYLLVETQVQKFENLYFICDYDNEDSIFSLLRENFRAVNLLMLNRQFEIISIQKPESIVASKEEKSIEIFSGSGFIANIGAFTTKHFSTPAITNLISESKLMNLHDKHAYIVSNFANEKKVKIGYYIMFFLLFIAIFFTAGSFMFGQLNEPISKKFMAAEKKLERITKKVNSKKTYAQSRQEKYLALAGLMNGKSNEKLFLKILDDLPVGIELDRLIVRDNTFQIFGNSTTISKLNLFYSQFINDVNFDEIKVDSYRRQDKALNFFELVGVIKR